MLGFDEYVPLQRVRRLWPDRVKVLDAPLFPGYDLLPLCICRSAARAELSERRIHRRIGKTEVPVDDAEVDSVRTLVASGKLRPNHANGIVAVSLI
jgi:hypothetical protein